LCGQWKRIPIPNADKLEVINKAISNEFGNSDYGDGMVNLCNDVQFFFTRNRGKDITAEDIVKFYLEYRCLLVKNKDAFTQELRKVMDILVRNDYIKINRHDGDFEQIIYVML
jgi:hypothetical protein